MPTQKCTVLALLLAGCACSPGSLSAPAEEGRTRVVVGVVEVGRGVDREKRIDRPTESFFPEDPVYVSVATRGKGRVSLTARFVLEDGHVVHDDTQHIVPDGPAVSEFHVMNPAGWPAGKHRVEILVDGRLQDTITFTVRARAESDSMKTAPAGPRGGQGGKAPGRHLGGTAAPLALSIGTRSGTLESGEEDERTTSWRRRPARSLASRSCWEASAAS